MTPQRSPTRRGGPVPRPQACPQLMPDGIVLLGNTRWKSAGLAKAPHVERMNQNYAIYSRAKIERLPLELT